MVGVGGGACGRSLVLLSLMFLLSRRRPLTSDLNVDSEFRFRRSALGTVGSHPL